MSSPPPSTLPDVSVVATPPQQPSKVPYAQRRIVLTFQLGTGSFGDGTANQLTIDGLRTFVEVQKANLPTSDNCHIRIWGLTKNQVNQLTKAGTVFQARNNYVAVQAGEKGGNLTTVFNGVIYEAYPDFSNQPDVSFVILANPANVIRLKPVPPVSFAGGVPASTVLQASLQGTGYSLENNGVNAVLSNPYFAGTAWSQIVQTVKAAYAYGHLDSLNKVLAIWPQNGSRSKQLPIVSPATGMIGYPSFQHNQIRARTEFDPQFVGAGPGCKVQIQSDLTAANGVWTAYAVTALLSSELPNGPWELDLDCAPTNIAS